jgi:hypothetical protein
MRDPLCRENNTYPDFEPYKPRKKINNPYLIGDHILLALLDIASIRRGLHFLAALGGDGAESNVSWTKITYGYRPINAPLKGLRP